MTPLSEMLRQDHDRLDRLLHDATAGPGPVDAEAYAAFRVGLLRHIGIEERLLIPALRAAQIRADDAAIDVLRLEHGAIVALMVPPPSSAVVATLRAILAAHNEREEGPRGLYAHLEELPEQLAAATAAAVRAAPQVPVHPHNSYPGILEATRRAVDRAGHAWIEP